jgi:AcrR family transcriptional regulator
MAGVPEVGPRRTPAHNEARDAIIAAALDIVAVSGSAAFQPNDVCIELGLSRSLVNFHFGGREGLIAEVMAVGYEQYVHQLRLAADAAGQDPQDRLLAWVDRQVDWTAANPGLAAVLNFQREASGIRRDLPPEIDARLRAAGSANFGFLNELVTAVRAARGLDAAGSSTGLDAAIIGWLTLGLSVWLAGRHGPTRGLNRADALHAAREHMRAVVLEMAAR